MLRLTHEKGAGKTTLGKNVENGHDRVYMKLPNRETVIGQVLDKYLKGGVPGMDDKQAQLLFTANLLFDKPKIEAALAAGKTVILDRYIPSAVVYYSFNVGSVQQQWIESLNADLPKPDMVVVLVLSPDEALRRINVRAGGATVVGVTRELYDTLTTQTEISKLYQGVYGDDPDTVFLDGDKTPEELRGELLRLINTLDIDDKPLRRYGQPVRQDLVGHGAKRSRGHDAPVERPQAAAAAASTSTAYVEPDTDAVETFGPTFPEGDTDAVETFGVLPDDADR